MLNDIAIPKNLNDFISARDAAIAGFSHAKRALYLAEKALDSVISYTWPLGSNPKLTNEEFVREIDRRMWRKAFDLTRFAQVMDREARESFNQSLDGKPPEFTADNVRSIFLSVSQESDLMFKRGLVNVFKRRNSGYKTNSKEAFKVDRKMVMTCITRPNYGRGMQMSSYGAAEINDIDRIFKTLDDKKHNQGELETALNAAWRDKPYVYEDDYYQVKGFKNSNAHFVFKRQDLLDKANLLIAEYYEDGALADGSV